MVTKKLHSVPLSATLGSLEQTEFYRLLVDSIQDYAIFLLDTSGKVATWNTGAQKLKGYKPSDIIGKHFSTFYTPEDLASNKPARELKIARELGHVEDEYWRVRKDGTRFWANVVITALYDVDQSLIGYAKVTRDLTERKRHEDELRSANTELTRQSTELEALGRAKDEFISLASHQLRTPATGVKQYLGILLEGYAGELNEQQKDYLLKAYEGNERQIDLVNSLLRIAQVDAGKIILDYGKTDIGVLLKDVVDEQVDTYKNRQQSLLMDIAKKPVIAYIDKTRFRMVLENLLDNASKYTPKGGKVSVLAKTLGKSLQISVSDTGVGIDEKFLPRLFAKFSRIPNELSATVGGSGLGLYWAHKIVELHKGTIEVTSSQGKGSTFTIKVPLNTPK